MDRIAHHRRPPAHAAHALQGGDGVLQVHQQVTAEHEIEAPEVVVELVHRARHPLHARPQGVAHEGEALRLGLVQGLHDLGPQAGRPIERRRVLHVEGHHLLGAALLHGEGPEAVHGPHVEAAQAGKVGGEQMTVLGAAVVEHPGRAHAVAEIDGVVPGEGADLGAELVLGDHGSSRSRRRRRAQPCRPRITRRRGESFACSWRFRARRRALRPRRSGPLGADVGLFDALGEPGHRHVPGGGGPAGHEATAQGVILGHLASGAGQVVGVTGGEQQGIRRRPPGTHPIRPSRWR